MSHKTMELPALPLELAAKYPHVWRKIADNWGTIFVPPYLRELFVTSSDRERAGFSPKAMDEILKLGKLHDDRFPHHALITNLDDDAWIDRNRR